MMLGFQSTKPNIREHVFLKGEDKIHVITAHKKKEYNSNNNTKLFNFLIVVRNFWRFLLTISNGIVHIVVVGSEGEVFTSSRIEERPT